MLKTAYIYLIGLMLILFAVQLLFNIAVIEYGYFIDPDFETQADLSISAPRLVSWFVCAAAFFVAGVMLFLKFKNALFFAAIGMIAYLGGALHDQFRLEPGSYFPNLPADLPQFVSELTIMGGAFGVIFLTLMGSRMAGQLR